MSRLSDAIKNYEKHSARLEFHRRCDYSNSEDRGLYIAVSEKSVCKALDELWAAQQERRFFVEWFAVVVLDRLWPGADRSFSSTNWKLATAIAHAIAETGEFA